MLAEPTSAQAGAAIALPFDPQTTRNGAGELVRMDRPPLPAEAASTLD
jgi:hypothetical protein